MGLTVSYTLSADGDAAGARRAVRALQRAARRLRFMGVEPMREFEGTALDTRASRPDTDPEWWLKVRTSYCLTAGGDGADRYVSVPASWCTAFMCWPGYTEPSCFGLCRYAPPRDLPRWARRQADEIKLFGRFHWQSFCKTQYASSPARGGKRHFLAAHARLIALLDVATDLGVLAEVADDAGYWEHRDRERLGREVDRWNRRVAAVVGGLGDALGVRGDAPIREFPDFEHLEADGRRELRDTRAEQ